jgi:hypothetical protein
MLLSVCVFLSLLALEKLLITILLCAVGLSALWLLPFPDLANRQFNLWLDQQDLDFRINRSLIVQLQEYCSQYSSANDLRIFFTFLVFFALVLIAVESRRSEMIARYDFIWKLHVRVTNKKSILTHSGFIV